MVETKIVLCKGRGRRLWEWGVCQGGPHQWSGGKSEECQSGSLLRLHGQIQVDI